MVDIGDLNRAINELDNRLERASYSADKVRDAISQLQGMKIGITDPKALAILERKISLLKEIRKESKDTYESERKGLEAIAGQNKQLLELLDKTILKHRGLRKGVLSVVGAYQSLKDKGDLGTAISQVSQLFGKFGILGEVIGITVSAYTKFQDRIQAVNKSIIDATASLGRFSDGVAMSQQQTLALSTGMAKYAQFVGIGTEELYKHTQGLSELGFSLEEIGLDRATGRITTLTEAIRGQTNEWGALSTSIGVSRATGLDIQSVMQTMGVQVKTLGDTVEEVAESFAQLSISADKSGLSTRILLPLVRSMQDQFKFLGFDSSAAAEALGRAGEVAESAGVTTGQATEAMARAIGGIAGMDFGQMAFFGQQLGMGGGLTAGFRFRQRAGGEGGANLAVEIGRTIGNIMGGGGGLISEEQAATNEHLAGIRLAQEKFAAQTLGLSQNEARVFINMSEKLENLRAIGKGQTSEAKDLEKTIKGMTMGEAEYRQKTLSLSQKIAQMMELITTLVGRLLLSFIRGFMGAAAGDQSNVIEKAMAGITEGKGFDEIFGPEGLSGAMDDALKGVEPVFEKWGRRFGTIWDLIFGRWYTAIPALFLGAGMMSAFSRGMAGLFSKGFGSLGGALIRGGGGVATGTAGEIVRGLTFGERWGQGMRAARHTMRASPAVRRLGNLSANLGKATQGLGRFGSVLRTLGGRVRGAARGLFMMGRTLLGPVGMVAAAAAAGTAIGTFIANLEFGGKSVAQHLGGLIEGLFGATEAAKKLASEHNKAAREAFAETEKIRAITGTKTSEARVRLEEKGVEGVIEERGAARGKLEIEQALVDLRRVARDQARAQRIARENLEDERDDLFVNEDLVKKYRNAMHNAALTLEITNKKIAEYKAALAKVNKPAGDAWDISKGGLIYASPGDMIVSADSRGRAGSKGPPGTAPRGEMGVIERDIILNVKFMHELIGQIAEQQVMISVEKDLVAPGKAGRSAMRHGGPSKGYGGG